MEWLVVFGLLGLGGLLYAKRASAAPSPKALPPAGDVPMLPGLAPPLPLPGAPTVAPSALFPIPDPGKFGAQLIPATGLGGPSVTVASFLPGTRTAMVQALSAREWRVIQALTPTILLVGPPDTANAANVDVLSSIRIALGLGFNVYMDADAALKLEGSSLAPNPATSGNIVAFARGLALPDQASGNEEVAMTPQAATEALDPSFPNSRFVLFAQGGEMV